MNWIDTIIEAAYDITGITLERMNSNLFIVEGKVKNLVGTNLSKRWQDSNEEDFSIYDGEDYLIELLYCWNCYSGPSAARLIEFMKKEGITIKSSCDYQGGLGMTTALLAEAYPEAKHSLTPGSDDHYSLSLDLFKKLGLKNVKTTFALNPVDLLVAQETFEHFADPIGELKNVIDSTNPKFYFDASSFELVNSPGHFKRNKDIRTDFNQVLKDSGYSVIWRDERFDETFEKRKPIETLPSLWMKI